MMILIGWRNLWRNKRRSIIMLGALVVGLWGLVMIYGANRSMIEGMVDLAIMSHTAHVQVHRQGYHDNPDINTVIEDYAGMVEKIKGAGHVVAASPRAKVRSMLSSSYGSNGVMLVGIDPEAEAEVTTVAGNMVDGDCLKAGDRNRIIIGASLADKLKVRPGKKLVIYARDANKELKVLGVKVAGTFDTGTDMVDKFIAFVPLSYFQENLGIENRIHEVAIRIDDDRNLDQVKIAVSAAVEANSGLEVLTWREMFPFLDQIFSLSAIGNYIMLVIVVIAISLGIANTMVMSVFERFREIGIMKAIGTRPLQIFNIVLVESVSLAITGLVLGSAISYATLLVWDRYGLDLSLFSKSLSSIGMPSVYYPIVYFEDWLMTWIAVVVLAVGSSLYPAIKAARKNPVEAIRM
jgi:ABC-type lipoprotein release transport system permease subunit